MKHLGIRLTVEMATVPKLAYRFDSLYGNHS